jgi:hypothetical protein
MGGLRACPRGDRIGASALGISQEEIVSKNKKKGMQSYNTHVRNSWECPPLRARTMRQTPLALMQPGSSPRIHHFLSSRLAGSEVSVPLFGICGLAAWPGHAWHVSRSCVLLYRFDLHPLPALPRVSNHRITVPLPTHVPVQACMPRSPCLYTHHTSHLRGCTD